MCPEYKGLVRMKERKGGSHTWPRKYMHKKHSKTNKPLSFLIRHVKERTHQFIKKSLIKKEKSKNC